MVLHEAVQTERRTVLGKLGQAVGGSLLLVLETADSSSFRVDSDGMASKKLRGVGPFAMVLHRSRDSLGIRIAQIAFVIAHDEQYSDPLAISSALELGEIASIPGPVLEELIDELDGVHAAHELRRLWELHVGRAVRKERPVKRPFGEGYLKRLLALSH